MVELRLHELPSIKNAITFSGTRFLTSVSRRKARDMFFDHLSWYQEFDAGVYGAAKGIDTLTGEWSQEFNLPFQKRIVIVPGDRSRVDWSFKNWATHVFYCPKGSTYKDRNQLMVLMGSALSAFPDYPEHDDQSKRSGTWQAVRQMRELRRPIMIDVLTGGRHWEP